jgi:hypothetical protein
MSDPNQPSGNKPSSPYSKLKLVRDLLVVVALVWIGIQAYWGYFKLKIWLAGFGTGLFWGAGLVGGFIYFHAVHKIHERIKEMASGSKKVALYVAFALGLLIVNPVPVSLALWLFTPPGVLHDDDFSFLIGCAIAGGIVLLLERLFAKKAQKPN